MLSYNIKKHTRNQKGTISWKMRGDSPRGARLSVAGSPLLFGFVLLFTEVVVDDRMIRLLPAHHLLDLHTWQVTQNPGDKRTRGNWGGPRRHRAVIDPVNLQVSSWRLTHRFVVEWLFLIVEHLSSTDTVCSVSFSIHLYLTKLTHVYPVCSRRTTSLRITKHFRSIWGKPLHFMVKFFAFGWVWI